MTLPRDAGGQPPAGAARSCPCRSSSRCTPTPSTCGASATATTPARRRWPPLSPTISSAARRGWACPTIFLSSSWCEGRAACCCWTGWTRCPTKRRGCGSAGRWRTWSTPRRATRCVVTSRPAAYGGEAVLGARFRHLHLQPMAPEQVARLVTRLYQAAIDDEDERARETAALLRAIDNLEKLRARLGAGERFITTPLLVRMIVIVHFSRRQLPEQRAELYREVVEVLLAASYHPDVKVGPGAGRGRRGAEPAPQPAGGAGLPHAQPGRGHAHHRGGGLQAGYWWTTWRPRRGRSRQPRRWTPLSPPPGERGNKFVRTSRIVGYREVRPTVEGLAECTLVDFDENEIVELRGQVGRGAGAGGAGRHRGSRPGGRARARRTSGRRPAQPGGAPVGLQPPPADYPGPHEAPGCGAARAAGGTVPKVRRDAAQALEPGPRLGSPAGPRPDQAAYGGQWPGDEGQRRSPRRTRQAGGTPAGGRISTPDRTARRPAISGRWSCWAIRAAASPLSPTIWPCLAGAAWRRRARPAGFMGGWLGHSSRSGTTARCRCA